MKRQTLLAGALLGSAFAAFAQTKTPTKPPSKPSPKPTETFADAPTNVKWKKTTLDPKFRAEGVAVADVNRDGKNDILVGDFWYEAPNWTPHEIRKPGNYGDGAKTYSDAFLCWADDFNNDGWSDILVLAMPGKPAKWYENPKGKPGHWKERVAWKSSCNEGPIFMDIFGDGKRRLVMASCEEGQMGWFEPSANIDAPWTMHPISKAIKEGAEVWGVNQFDHGLGAGDMNGDGRADIIVRQGWWEQPADVKTRKEPWPFHTANLGEDCANIWPIDGDDDGQMDAVTSSAHKRGIWFHRRTPTRPGEFRRSTLFDGFTQSHALAYEDINGDGAKDFITGKRWWAHGPTGDVDPMATPVLYWFEVKKAPNAVPTLVPHLIDTNSGIGTQFQVADINGDNLLDIAIANKKGVFVFEQVR
jgi:hypothetical protein